MGLGLRGFLPQAPKASAPHVSSAQPPDKKFVNLTEAFNTADTVPKFTMAQILHYVIWRTAVDGLANADSKSISQSAMNLSRGGHIQQIMVCASDDSIELKGICRAEMKKKVQYKLALTISGKTAAITRAECGCPAGEGPLATCKHIGAFCFTLEEFCRLGRTRGFLTCTDQLQSWNQPKPAKPVMIPVTELDSRRQELSALTLTSPPAFRKASIWDPRPMHLP